MTQDLRRAPRIAYLELIRGLAALQVLLLHFLAAFAPELVFSLPAGAALAGYIHLSPLYFLYDGYSAVYIFFTLSGYVLTRSFERHPAQPSSQILARTIRLGLPAIAATLVAAAVMLMFGKPNVEAGDLSGSAWFAESMECRGFDSLGYPGRDRQCIVPWLSWITRCRFSGALAAAGRAIIRNTVVDTQHRVLWLDDYPLAVRVRAAITRCVVVGRAAGCDLCDSKRLYLLFRRSFAGYLPSRGKTRAGQQAAAGFPHRFRSFFCVLAEVWQPQWLRSLCSDPTYLLSLASSHPCSRRHLERSLCWSGSLILRWRADVYPDRGSWPGRDYRFRSIWFTGQSCMDLQPPYSCC